MDYLTNYYKNLSEELALEEGRLTDLLKNLAGQKASQKVAQSVSSLGKFVSGIGSKLSQSGQDIATSPTGTMAWPQEGEERDFQRRTFFGKTAKEHDAFGMGGRRIKFTNINHEYVRDFILHPSQWSDPTKLSDATLSQIKDRITQENAGRKKPLTADQHQKLVDKYTKEHAKAQTDAQNDDKLGRIAEHIRIFSEGEKAYRSGDHLTVGATKPDEAAKATGEWTRAAWSTDFEPFNGGHSGSLQHPDVIAYHNAWKASGESIPHPDTLFGPHTFHVEDAFADVLPKELKKANKENKRKFDENVVKAREIMAGSQDESTSFRTTPFKMNESRKIYSKVKKLLNEEEQK